MDVEEAVAGAISSSPWHVLAALPGPRPPGRRYAPVGLRSCFGLMDPAFGRLKAREVRAMWCMLAERATDLEITFEVKHADEGSGAVHWEATYPFSKTGRRVHNVIEAQFGFHEGRILAHRDQFDLWAWSRQALGLPSLLLGWSPWLRAKIQREARAQLAKWMTKA